MIEAFIAAAGVAALSITGAFIFRNSSHVKGSHRFIIPAAIGMFLGIIFFELIPETLAGGDELWGPGVIVIGFLAFYYLSHALRTYHHHHHPDCCDNDCTVPKSRAHMLLIGDGVHNIADGVIIATAFSVSPELGVAVAIGVALHELPQEIAEYGLLIQAGYSKAKATFYNLLSASSILLGVVLAFAILQFGDYIWILTGLAAGNLLYIATADMVPELHGEKHRGHFAQTFISTLVGLLLIVGILEATHGEHGHDHGQHSETEIHDESNEHGHESEDDHDHDNT